MADETFSSNFMKIFNAFLQNTFLKC